MRRRLLVLSFAAAVVAAPFSAVAPATASTCETGIDPDVACAVFLKGMQAACSAVDKVGPKLGLNGCIG